MKFKNPLKGTSEKRRRELVYMVLSLALILLAVPGALYLMNNFNETVLGYDSNYSSLASDQYNETLSIIGGDDETYTQQIYTKPDTLATGTNLNPQSLITWGGVDSNNSMVIVSDGNEKGIGIFSPWNLSDLISSNNFKWKFSFVFPESRSFRVRMWFVSYNDDDQLLFTNKILFGQDLITGSSSEYYHNTTALDLMTFSATYLGPEDFRLYFEVYSTETGFDTGSTFEWDLGYYDPPENAISEVAVIRIGAIVIGVILIIVAVASTPYWNPATSNNPGIIDKWFNKISTRRNKKRGGK